MLLHRLRARWSRAVRRLIGREPVRDWRDMNCGMPPGWADRAAFAAEKLGAVTGVADMGCGTMALERHLAPGTCYIPVDLYARDARTIVCDFDREPPPETGMPAVACLGLLSHLQRPDRLMAALARLHDRAIVSYPVTDAPNAASNPRRPVTGYATADMERLLMAAGWRIAGHYAWPDQSLWLLTK